MRQQIYLNITFLLNYKLVKKTKKNKYIKKDMTNVAIMYESIKFWQSIIIYNI